MADQPPPAISLDWYRSVIDQRAVAIDVEALPADAGLVGDLYRVRVSTADSAPVSVIVKVPTTDDSGGSGRMVGEMLNSWRREAAFYTDVAPVEGVDTPAFLGQDASFDPLGPAIVLEDVAHAPIDDDHGPTEAQVDAALDAAAALHASHWADAPSACPYPWMPAFGSGAGAMAAGWERALPHFRTRYAAVIPPRLHAIIDALPGWLETWTAGLDDRPATLVHSDFRADNVLFTEAGVVVIDWQTALFGPAAMDVACFCATSLPIEVRRRAESRLLARYVDQLASAGVELARADLERSYDENLLWWMGQFGHNLAFLDPPTPRAGAALMTMVERVFTAGLDRRVELLID